ncbi:DUF1254 domain-containing protein [Catalinimonas sp. 4WD22]|uniref:DUF1254 domain-containing protein n=1 Tax=Catalinimonas locisalis TaxID=3133978 RepID=UPI003100F5D4
MVRTKLYLFMLLVIFTAQACTQSPNNNVAEADSLQKVTPETFIRAETDNMFSTDADKTTINEFVHYRSLTPLDRQNVIRMNRDVLYSSVLVDTKGGATITIPEMPDDRYMSTLVVDNDHYVPTIIHESGTHPIPDDTRYVIILLRIQVLNPNDPEEIKMINNLQDQFRINASSSEPFPGFHWDRASLDSLRDIYNAEFAKYDRFPSDWAGARGEVNEETRHLAAAGGWGLFPEKEAIYINYNGGNLSGDKCYMATYEVPDNEGFWSITVYGEDGKMKSENMIQNASNTTFNEDGTFTVYFGSEENCPEAENRLDITDGWNFLMRVYLPGESVRNGTYQLPEVTEVK